MERHRCFFSALLALAAGCDPGADERRANGVAGSVGFTTFDQDVGGCLDAAGGRCTRYAHKHAVYLSGGPASGGLVDGAYFFAVLTPGAQAEGFQDGAPGNLSDRRPGLASNDPGSGDDRASRGFLVANHEIISAWGHPLGRSPDGRLVLAAAPFDDTDNFAGVYVLAICPQDAVSAAQCRHDSFSLYGGGRLEQPMLGGAVYYDANGNGRRDAIEPGLPGWPIRYAGGTTPRAVTTDESGRISLDLAPDLYTFSGPAVATPWLQSGNLEDQSVGRSGATVRLTDRRTYVASLVEGGQVEGLYFGYLCLGPGGGRSVGDWANHLESLTSVDVMALAALSLRDRQGHDVNPASGAALREYLLGARADNMAYMLSAQLAAMSLSLHHGLVDRAALVRAPGFAAANRNDLATVGDLVAAASATLHSFGLTPSGHPLRQHQELLKDLLEEANHDRSYVAPSPASCPPPAF